MKSKDIKETLIGLGITLFMTVVFLVVLAIAVLNAEPVNKNESVPKQDSSQDCSISSKIETDVSCYTSNETQYIYDIPLTAKQQEYVKELCIKYDVNERIIYGMMMQETNFDTSFTSPTPYVGVMQVNVDYLDDVAPGHKYNTFEEQAELGILYYVYIRNLYKPDTAEEMLEHYNKGSDISDTTYYYSHTIIDYANNIKLK